MPGRAKRYYDPAKARASVFSGQRGERALMNLMSIMGFRSIRKIHNEWQVKRGPSGRIVSAKPGEKVVGDVAAIIPGIGRSVLAECKYRDDLSYSDLEAHQHKALAEHAANGGLSLIGWHSPAGTFLFDYTEIVGPKGSDAPLRPGKRMHANDAMEYRLTRIPTTEDQSCDNSQSRSSLSYCSRALEAPDRVNINRQ